MSDLISRADAIEAVMAEGRKVYTSEYANAERVIYEADAVEALSMLPSAKVVEVRAEQFPPKVPTEWINDGMVLVPQHDWIEMQKELEGYVSAEAVQGVGRYEKAMQKLQEMPRYLNGVKAKQINKIQSEAVQGEWVDITNPESVCEEWECSKCGNWNFAKTDFCPHCGARMKGGDDE